MLDEVIQAVSVPGHLIYRPNTGPAFYSILPSVTALFLLPWRLFPNKTTRRQKSRIIV